jgi:P-type E1-E2 ATPase
MKPGPGTAQKAALAEELGAAQVVAIGNGVNDAEMLRSAAVGIAVLGPEGLAVACATAADIVTPHIEAALDLLLYPRRLVATLRT